MIVVCRYNSKDSIEAKDATQTKGLAIGEVQSFTYKIAGKKIVSSEEIQSLTAFSVEGGLQGLNHFTVPDEYHLPKSKRRLHYQGAAQFNQKMREIQFWRCDEMAQIDIEGVPVCTIDFKVQRIVVLNDDAFDSRLNLEVITGPAIIALLAEKGVYCLHAGAVNVVGDQSLTANIAFLGESGVGKSTLSKYVDERWHQLSDDILPIYNCGAFGLFMDFPQLKLPNAKPPVFSLKEREALLNCVVILNTQATEKIQIEPLTKTQALLSLIRHTVAVRLFDDKQTKEHLTFVTSLVDSLPVLSVTYPRNIDELPKLQSVISNYVLDVNLMKIDH